ncbi:hypothetical protein [Tenacibaculum maritimum]|uniref:hypothetical protein n=1 Tax=Tenacibaculum maritimum TaxID=107401 RepID=UPI0012E518E1|nr:hypothetical protein [Tenacibaculum maritimum]MCD9563792.1 hypothetical protein [Tenacibaculum maritimum]MCD9566830.1 hypothetical protein [Tenacibaculum maritimum]MCD9580156.1 hypothetical protein [Tenacibaculum maritimum]MCD9597679.1 hypothetical protein [Tenacibaculum maritimum]MCD9614799.1 hypothetical protein [Tenacibaculum maritimum]
MKKVTYLFIYIIINNCNHKKDNNLNNPIINYQINKTEMQYINTDSLIYNDFMLFDKKRAINKYGKPYSQELFILDDAQGEFRNGISDAFNEKERQSESIIIEELTWEKNKNTWVTVWYQLIGNKTIPKDTLTWEKGTDF